MTVTNIPNENGVPTVTNTNVVPSEPAYTGSEPQPEAPAPVEAPVEAPTEEPTETVETPTEAPTESVETPPEEPAHQPITAEHLQRLHEAQQLEPVTEAPDIFDDYGNVDPNKFNDYLNQRDARVFEQATYAATVREETQKTEQTAWDTVYSEYGEIKDNPALQNALRGARIQDLTAGGDGDLARLAKELVAPFRTAKIQATEAINKTVSEAEALETTKPTAATPPKEAPSLVHQLKAAIADGDTQRAQSIRHAIRKEQIYGKTK